MRAIETTAAFRKDFKRLARSPRHHMSVLKAVIELLAADTDLPPRLHDHSLGGNWIGFRECHIRPDWLLIYALAEDTLTLVRTGSHTELFG